MEDTNMEMGQEPQQSQMASGEAQNNQARPAQPAAAGPSSSGVVTETAAVGPFQLSAEDLAENEKRWNVPEVTEFGLKVIAAIVKANQEHRNPLVKITSNHEGRIGAELKKAVEAIRQPLVNAGMEACGIYHMIWLSGNVVWRTHVHHSTDMNIPKPDNKAPACLMYEKMVSHAKTKAQQEGKEWVTFQAQRRQFRIKHGAERESRARIEFKLEAAKIELAALEAAQKQLKIIDLSIDTNRKELRELWSFIMRGTPIPAEGPFTVTMPLDMDEGPMGIKSLASLNSELAMFVRVKKTNTAWVVGFTCTADELDQEAALGFRHELFQAYDALVCYAIQRLEKPAKPIQYSDVLGELVVSYEAGWNLVDVAKKIAANLNKLSEARRDFTEIRAKQVKRAQQSTA